MSTKLRFAPLIRVSGEEQARHGESLQTQRQQIESAVETLSGVIPPELAHRYSGQEHATPGYERLKLNQLLEDAAAGLFDAVIVADISRWSRDNDKSKAGLKVLRKHGIRFFVLTTEHDLNNAEAELVLGMFAQINQYLARTQAKKSVDNRLARLRRGCPACGSLPYGRTFNKETEEWGIDPDARRFIGAVAKRYVAGDSLEAMAKEFRKSTTSLWRNLVKQSGPEFIVLWNKTGPPDDDEDKRRIRHKGSTLESLVSKHRGRAKRVHERVQEIDLADQFIFIIDVPPLLDAETLERVRAVADHRRKNRGPHKHDYLLKSYVYCGSCGKALTGQSQDKPTRSFRYYRHNLSKRLSGSDCGQCLMCVDADAIEEAVLLHLFATLGNVSKIRAAIQAAIPNADAQAEARQELEYKTAELRRLSAAKERVVDAVANGQLVGEAITRKMQALEASEDAIQARIETLQTRLGNTPTPEFVRSAAAHLAQRRAMIRGAMGRTSLVELKRMTFKDKRELVDLFFSGKGPAGEPLGVFVTRAPTWKNRGRTGRRWLFEIRGRFTLEPMAVSAPLSDRQRKALLSESNVGTVAANLKRISNLTPVVCGT